MKLSSMYFVPTSKLKNLLLGCVVAVGAGLHAHPAHAQAALSTDMDPIDKTLDLFFVGTNSNLYETLYPFSSATQITGISNRPPVAPMGNSVSYVNTIYGAPEIYYITADSSGNLDVEQLWSTGFSPTNISQKTGAPSAVPGSSIVGFIDSCAGSDNVFYLANNGHIELLNWTPSGGFVSQDLTQSTGTGAALGTALVGHVKGTAPNQSQEVFYVESDHHVHELWRWSGCAGGAAFDGWHNTDVSLANGDTGVTAGSNTALASMYDAKAGTDAVFYVGADGHLHELYFSTSAIWSNVDLTHNTNGPTLLPGTSLTAHINTVAGSEEVYFFDTSSNVREMWTWSSSPTSWNSDAQSINSYAGGAPAAAIGSPLITDINTLAALDDVYYVGANQHIYELTGGSWHYVDITAQAMAPKVRWGSPGTGPTLINFDTDTLGNAITSGAVINDTYSSWGVTFSALTCVLAVVQQNQCVEPPGGGNIYAVAYPYAASGTSFPKGSAPNAVSSYGSSAYMLAQAGVMRATFTTPQAKVTIMAYQICGASNGFGCIGTFPANTGAYLDAYDANNNLLLHSSLNPNNQNQWWELEVCGVVVNGACQNTANIAYVQFSVGYAGPDNPNVDASFDNLQFDTVAAPF